MQDLRNAPPPSATADTRAPAIGGVPAARQRGLDGLRGLAVIAVLMFHQGFGWARGGYLGVSLFFTLSGFLIARLLIEESEHTGAVRLGTFWGRRLRRLVPAALFALLLVCVYGAFFATEGQRLSLRGDVWSSLANVTNWRFMAAGDSYADLFKDPSPVQHFWSLAIEEQFYLVFPLVVAGVAALSVKWGRASWGIRRSLGTVVVVLMGASLVEQLLFSSVDRIYYGTDTRAFELLAGVLLACCWTPAAAQRRTTARVAGVGGVAALVAMIVGWATIGFGTAWLFDGGLAAVALVSVVVIVAATVPGPVRAIGSWRPLVAVGLVSYGLYLYHWPVFLVVDRERTGLQGWALFGVRCAVTAGLAVGSYYLLELPFRKGAIGRVRMAPLIWIAAIAVVAVAVPLTVPLGDQTKVINAATFDRADALVAKQRLRAESAPDRAPALNGETAANTPAAPMRVYVVGDSTGVVFAGGLALYAQQTGKVDVRSGAYRACPMADVDEFKWYMLTGLEEQPVGSDCFGARTKWAADLAGWRPDMILVVSGPADVSPVHPVGAPDNEWLVPTEPAGRVLLEQGITSTSGVLQSLAPGVPQLWLTSPYILRVQEMEGRAPDPTGPQVHASTDVYNQVLAQLAATQPLVATVPWADYFNAKPISADAEERPDGVHIPPERVAEILGDWFPKFAAARAALVTLPSR